MSRRPPLPPRQKRRGFGLPEALIALAVLTLALLGAMRWQAIAHVEAGVARERTDAVELARQHLERLRAFTALDPTPGVEAFADIDTVERSTPGPTARFALRSEITTDPAARSKQAAVTVSWDDRTGTRRQVTLRSVIDGALPVHSAVLAQPAWPRPVARPLNRHPDIPLSANDLGNGQSAWAPATGSPNESGAPTFISDNASGEVVALCAAARLGPTPTSCQAYRGTWLSGHVRFSLGEPPDPVHADDTPMRFDMQLEVDAPARPAACDTTVHQGPAPGGWFARYACVVPLPPGGGWSGRLSVVPRGWVIGPRRTDRQVCRFSADLDGSGAIDRNEEHPDRYAEVTVPLAQQNFLVVRGDQRCPHSPPPPHNDASADTVLHPP